jgi:hypothetical protein
MTILERVKNLPEPQFEITRDTATPPQFRWRLRAENTQIIAVSGEGYVSKQGCQDGIASVKENVPKAKTVDLT